jgi:hypothetical protein
MIKSLPLVLWRPATAAAAAAAAARLALPGSCWQALAGAGRVVSGLG